MYARRFMRHTVLLGLTCVRCSSIEMAALSDAAVPRAAYHTYIHIHIVINQEIFSKAATIICQGGKGRVAELVPT